MQIVLPATNNLDYCTCTAVTSAIILVFQNYVYFRAIQDNKYPSCSLLQTLRINNDLPIVLNGKGRSRLSPSISALGSIFFKIQVSFLISYNTYFSQLSCFVSHWSDERLLVEDICWGIYSKFLGYWVLICWCIFEITTLADTSF